MTTTLPDPTTRTRAARVMAGTLTACLSLDVSGSLMALDDMLSSGMIDTWVEANIIRLPLRLAVGCLILQLWRRHPA